MNQSADARKAVHIIASEQASDSIPRCESFIRLLLALYKDETNRNQILMSVHTPTLPFLFTYRKMKWSGVGTDDLLVATKYACVSLASAFYVASQKADVKQDVIENLKISAQVLTVANNLCPRPHGIEPTPFELLGGVDLISYIFEYNMYSSQRSDLVTASAPTLMRELRRIAFMHELLRSIEKRASKTIIAWQSKELDRLVLMFNPAHLQP